MKALTIAVLGAQMPTTFHKLSHTEEAHLLGSNRLPAVRVVQTWQSGLRLKTAYFYSVRQLLAS